MLPYKGKTLIILLQYMAIIASKGKGFFLIALLAQVFVASTAVNATGAAVAEARQLLAAGHAQEAYSILAPLQSAQAGNPQFDYLLGIAALDIGKPNEAVFALERVLAVEPGNQLARAELARAYFAVRELEASKREFLKLKEQPGVPEPAQRTMDRYLAAIERARAPDAILDTTVSGYVEAFGGYDSNVNSATSASAVAIPAFGGAIARLDPAGVEQSAMVSGVAGGIRVAHPVSRKWSVLAGADALDKETEDEFDVATVGGYTGLSFSQGRQTYTLAAQAEKFLLDKDSFRDAYGGVLQWKYRLTPRDQVSAYVQGTVIEFPEQAIRDATRYVGGLGYTHVFSGNKYTPVVFAGAYGGVHDARQATADFVGYDVYGVRLGGQVQAAADTAIFASAAGEFQRYHGDEPFFLTKREDDRGEFVLGLNYTPLMDWIFSPQVAYIRHYSNITLFDYERTEVLFTARREFK